AATPTAAAETVTPDQATWLQSFDWYQQRMQQLINSKIQRYSENTQWLRRRLQQRHPETQILRARQRCNELIKRLSRSGQSLPDLRHSKLATCQARLNTHNPLLLIKQKQQSARFLDSRLQKAILNLLSHKKSLLGNTARTLNAINPLQTLERGYSITLDNKGVAITSVRQINDDDTIETRLHDGRIISKVSSRAEDSE
ncbi:MAG: exodeoxyribonuclease VII large subunit, partial [Gammaproteobacteria bacterium]|nr:exodeoxyribonuclease VII large subunit [Gammaproteobacteria bacterium]